MTDWADDIAEGFNFVGYDPITNPLSQRAGMARALRRAKADGMRAANEIMMNTPYQNASGLLSRLNERFFETADKIEKGET